MRTAAQDLRVYKTQKLICEAVSELLKTKSVNEISVREIAEKVHISRGTFYLHYKDVFDLVERIEQDILRKFEDILNTVYIDPENSLHFLMNETLCFVAQESDIFTVLLSKNGDIAFLEKIKHMIKQRALTYWRETYGDRKIFIFEYHLGFILSGIIGLVHQWLLSGMKESPHDMALLMERIIREGSRVLD